MHWGDIIIGFIAGGLTGITAMAFLIASRRDEDKEDNHFSAYSKNIMSENKRTDNANQKNGIFADKN